MAGETVTEIIVNLKDEIQKYAATKNHTHLDLNNEITELYNKFKNYCTKEQILNYLNTTYHDTLIAETDGKYAPKSHLNDDASTTKKGHTKIANKLTATETNPVQGKAIVSYITNALKNINVESDPFSRPKRTTTKINSLFTPGYFIYEGNADTFYCMPDVVQYKNGLIRVEKQSNHVIQHVYSTSWSTNSKNYKIDGREFVRHGYTTTQNNKVVGKWFPWHVSHLPWRKRNDLLLRKGTNVTGTFDLYESTAGYTFRWIQGGNDQVYELNAPQYEFASVYTFKQLPILPNTFGNLVGHIDIRITDSDFKIRSINRQNERIIGMDVTYFMPRMN